MAAIADRFTPLAWPVSPTTDVIDGVGAQDTFIGQDNFDDVYFGTAGPDKISGLGGNDLLYGDLGDDTILGGDGGDSLRGEAGNDSINGGRGNDFLDGGIGADTLDGGLGFDIVGVKYFGSTSVSLDFSGFVAGQTTTIVDGPDGGTAKLIGIEALSVSASYGDDTVIGAEGYSVITTLGGNDYVDGRGGDDRIFDFIGDSTLIGGAGDDVIHVTGAAYSGAIAGASGHDRIDGGTGLDTVQLDWSENTAELTMSISGGHVVVSSADGKFGADITHVEAFDIFAGSGGATLTGGAGDDILHGGYDGVNSLVGGGGNDTLQGGGGNDTLLGGAGLDCYVMLYGAFDAGTHGYLFDASALQLGSGVSVFEDNTGGLDTVSGFDNADIWMFIQTNDTAIGTAGDDVIHDYLGSDSMVGGEGDDIILQTFVFPSGGEPGDFNDTMEGGDGIDTLSWAQATYGAHTSEGWLFDLTSGTVVGFGTGTDTISGFEHVIGSGAMDTILGSKGNETLEGGAGDDLLSGLGGKDQLFGGDGYDTLVGGATKDVLAGGDGEDVFVFLRVADSAGDRADRISDLSNDDTIDLSAIDADTNTVGDQAFVLVGAFGRHAGELMLSIDGKITTLAADVDGDGAADFSISIKGDHTDFTSFVF